MIDPFEKERPEWVCHMAARAGARPSIQDPFVFAGQQLHKFGVKNFVFASLMSSVYGGSSPAVFLEEENANNPVSPYAASKKVSKLLAYTNHHLCNFNISALPFFTVYSRYGPVQIS